MSATEASSAIDRVLGLVGADDEADVAGKLDIAKQLLILHAAILAWHALWIQLVLPSTMMALGIVGVIALGTSGCFVASLLPRFASWSAPVALLLLLCNVALTLPGTSGHTILASFCLLFFVVLDERRPEQSATLLEALKWTVLLVVAWSGLQKLLYGAWAGGEFLSVAIATGEPIGAFFEWAVPAAEVARLQSLDPTLAEEGPFRADAPMLVAVSNLVWILQVALPLGLLHRATRLPAVAALLALVVVFDLFAAREVLTSLLLATLLLLHAPRDWIERAYWPLVVLYVAALGVAMGLLPGGGLLKGTWVPGRLHL